MIQERMTIDIPSNLKKEAKMIAISKGITLKEYVKMALMHQVEHDDGEFYRFDPCSITETTLSFPFPVSDLAKTFGPTHISLYLQ